MKCPKCGSDCPIADYRHRMNVGYECSSCGIYFTEWQQNQIDILRAGLEEIVERNANEQNAENSRFIGTVFIERLQGFSEAMNICSYIAQFTLNKANGGE